MFQTGIRQFRMAMSMVWGRPFDPAGLAKLVGDAARTVAEFGDLGDQAREVIDTPFASESDRRDHADRSLRRTARRLALRSPFYAERFAAAGFAPRTADTTSLLSLPVTTKQDLITRSADLICHGSRPQLATRTTGTTGRALEIWLSGYELQVAAALNALSGVLHDELRADDVMQVHVSSRATAAVQLTSLACRLVGTRCRILGIVSPESALADLAGTATVMSANASYLAELVVAARRAGMGPGDFRLRRIDSVSEILSTSLRDAAELTFGAPVHDNFGLTEAIPVTATSCSAGHLHHDLTTGHTEVLDLHTGRPAHANALGTLVMTPYFPYRECMPVFRYDTRDVVRALSGTGDCEQAGLPGTSQILGKAEQLIHLASGLIVTPRDLVEAIEALPSQSWPARFKASPEGDRLGLRLPESAVRGLSERGLVDHFAERGLPVSVTVVDDDQGRALRPVRSDLHELAFPAPVPVGA